MLSVPPFSQLKLEYSLLHRAFARIKESGQGCLTGSKHSVSVSNSFWLSWWLIGKESDCQCRRLVFNPWFRKIPWRREWQPTPVFLPGKSHGQRSLAGYSTWGCKESDMI